MVSVSLVWGLVTFLILARNKETTALILGFPILLNTSPTNYFWWAYGEGPSFPLGMVRALVCQLF